MALVALGRGELYTEDELKTLLAREISKRPWPTVGTVVSISHDWDGPSTYNSEEFLSLKSQDRVRVTEVSPLGAWLRGTVVGSNRSGWFGGPGCEAAMSVNLDVPLGSEMDEELPFSKAEPEAFDEDDGDLGDLEKDLEDYVARNHVDSSAATALKALSPEMQAEIIKNDMTNCRSPSAVLLSRIDKLKAQWPHTGAPGRPVAPTVAPRKAPGGSAAPTVPARVLPSTAPGGAMPQLRGSAARSRSPRGHPQVPHRKETKENWEKGLDVEDFIERHQLDERAVVQLRSLPPEELQIIVNADLTNARNPSAVVLSRIQRVRDDGHRADAHRHAVEEYLSRNSVDEVAGGALKMLPMEVQQQIMQSDLSNSRNPSAVLLSRIRAAEASLGVPAGQPPPPGGGGHGGHGGHGHGGSPPAPQGGWGHGGGGGGWGPAGQMVEDFIQQYGLDEKVAVDLRMLPEEVLQEVMSCNIRNARNPSAMVRSRIQAVQSKSKIFYMVEDYLGRYEVDEVAASALRNAQPEVQTRVMEEEMVNCRNPSAVLISRIRAIEKGQR